jgi:hypothetical protein
LQSPLLSPRLLIDVPFAGKQLIDDHVVTRLEMSAHRWRTQFERLVGEVAQFGRPFPSELQDAISTPGTAWHNEIPKQVRILVINDAYVAGNVAGNHVYAFLVTGYTGNMTPTSYSNKLVQVMTIRTWHIKAKVLLRAHKLFA